MVFARWFYAPTGRKGIAQGKAKRRPGIRYETIFASPERAGKKPGTVPTRYFNGAATWKSRKVAGRREADWHGNRFNGAATWKSRKGRREFGDMLRTTNASMGPRLGSRGKSEPDRATSGSGVLQWGRDLEVAESQICPKESTSAVVLQWGRDLEVAERAAYKQAFLDAAALQWGRDLEVAESWTVRRKGTQADWLLQWGRDLEVAES